MEDFGLRNQKQVFITDLFAHNVILFQSLLPFLLTLPFLKILFRVLPDQQSKQISTWNLKSHQVNC